MVQNLLKVSEMDEQKQKMRVFLSGTWSVHNGHIIPETEIVVPAPKEMKVLELICRGRTNNQIAQELSIKEITVKNYVTALMRGTRTQNRTELAMKVVKGEIKLGVEKKL